MLAYRYRSESCRNIVKCEIKEDNIPDCPHAVHLTVVRPKGRVSGRGEEITARVAANGVVHTAMRSNLRSVGDTLGHETVLVDIGPGEELQDGSVLAH